MDFCQTVCSKMAILNVKIRHPADLNIDYMYNGFWLGWF